MMPDFLDRHPCRKNPANKTISFQHARWLKSQRHRNVRPLSAPCGSPPSPRVAVANSGCCVVGFAHLCCRRWCRSSVSRSRSSSAQRLLLMHEHNINSRCWDTKKTSTTTAVDTTYGWRCLGSVRNGKSAERRCVCQRSNRAVSILTLVCMCVCVFFIVPNTQTHTRTCVGTLVHRMEQPRRIKDVYDANDTMYDELCRQCQVMARNCPREPQQFVSTSNELMCARCCAVTCNFTKLYVHSIHTHTRGERKQKPS